MSDFQSFRDAVLQDEDLQEQCTGQLKPDTFFRDCS